MRMQNSGKELLHSLPIEVEFAGFRGNTLSLAKAGWDLSMVQNAYSCRGGYELRLAMRHAGAKLYAISRSIEIDHGRLSAVYENGLSYARFLSTICFSIECVSPDISFRHVMPLASRSATFGSQFEAIDPYPQERIVEESIKDFKFFKVSNPSIKDIIVSPDQVPELLDMVLRAQKPMMDKVRSRERSRENTEWARQNMQEVKPAHHVHAQLITLAS